MTIYHLGGDGVPKVCKAIKVNCPLGGEHFNSLPEAKLYAELQFSKEMNSNEEKPLESIISVAQRRRMWEQNIPMSYIHPLGTVLISKRGDLWTLVEREQTGGPLDHKFTLENRRSKKRVVVNTSYERAPGERAPEDFVQLKPRSFKVDGPPLKTTKYLVDLPPGRLKLENAIISKIRIRTIENELDKSLPRSYNEFGEIDRDKDRQLHGRELDAPRYRYLVTPKEAGLSLENSEDINSLSIALWAQAGRDEASWKALDEEQKKDVISSSKVVKKAEFFTKNGSTNFKNGDLRDNQFDSFWLPGGTPTSSIALYKTSG